MKKTSMTKNKIKQQQIKYKVSYKLMKINNLEKSWVSLMIGMKNLKNL